MLRPVCGNVRCSGVESRPRRQRALVPESGECPVGKKRMTEVRFSPPLAVHREECRATNRSARTQPPLLQLACAMANAETLARFQNAIMNARQLPPDLLTNSQKLKLYALYKQTEQPAPEDPPPRVNPLARAKVAAAHTRRSWSLTVPAH